MNRHYLAASLLALGLTASAVPAKRIAITVSQPDGTTLTLTRAGDETFHTYLTADGLTVAGNAAEGYRYVTPDGISAVLAHDAGARTTEEASYLKANADRLDFASLKAARKPSMRQLSKQSAARPHAAKAAETTDLRISSDVPCTGSPRIPVILVAYKDYDFRDGKGALQTFTDFFQNGEKSAHAYFNDQSNGLFTPQFDVYGPITLSGNRKEYGGNTSSYWGDEEDVGVGAMVGEACQGMDGSVDFSQYDNDGDGVCDVVIVLYAGDGEASSYLPNSEDAIWPCQWYLSESDFGKSLRLDGVKVDKFAVFNELLGIDRNTLDGVGTVAHEFSHCIGLPDFYVTTNNSSVSIAMDSWSLMDYGCYNDDGFTPIGYSAFEKYSLGWISLEAPDAPAHYTLPVFNTGAKNDVALKLNSPNANEYYIVENRQRQGWDSYMQSEGLLITHVNYNSSKWNQNAVNNTRPLGYTFTPADNKQSHDNLEGDLWPYGSKDSFTDNSSPAATLNSTSGKRLGKPLTEMVQNADGTVSFWYDKGNMPALGAPEPGTDDIEMTTTSFTATWKAPAGFAEPDKLTYSLKVSPYKEPQPGAATLFGSYDFSEGESAEWMTDGYVDYAYNDIPAYKLASAKQPGALYSPDIRLDGATDKITLIISAMAYSSSENTLNVNILDNLEATVSTQTLTLSTDFEDYTVVLDAKSDAVNTVELLSTAKKRCYVKSVTIYTGAFDGAATVAETAEDGSMTFTGITGTSYKVEGLESGMVYEYRVKAHAEINGEKQESAWSAARTVDLSKANSAITVAEAESVTETPVYYTLQGVRIDGTPAAAGIYIRRQGNTVTKVAVR